MARMPLEFPTRNPVCVLPFFLGGLGCNFLLLTPPHAFKAVKASIDVCLFKIMPIYNICLQKFNAASA